MTIFNVF